MSAQLVDRRPEGPRGWLLSVAVPAEQAAAYTAPGQYCRLGVSGEGGYFAIASAPGTSPFEFYIQPAGGVSDRLVALEVGAALEVAEPMGPGFGLDRVLASPGPVWVLAAGSGLSGVRAALGVLAGRSVHLLVGVKFKQLYSEPPGPSGGGHLLRSFKAKGCWVLSGHTQSPPPSRVRARPHHPAPSH
jgi:NAD(P)H-flavin reductase